jgi:hypothetical protein
MAELHALIALPGALITILIGYRPGKSLRKYCE